MNQLSAKYGVNYSSLAAWCYAYPFRARELPHRTYLGPSSYLTAHRAHAEEKSKVYVKELNQHAKVADPTWFIMGDPLPSRAAINKKHEIKSAQKITLPSVPVMFTMGADT